MILAMLYYFFKELFINTLHLIYDTFIPKLSLLYFTFCFHSFLCFFLLLFNYSFFVFTLFTSIAKKWKLSTNYFIMVRVSETLYFVGQVAT